MDKVKTKKKQTIMTQIDIKQIDFSYQEENGGGKRRVLFKNFSLHLKAGQFGILLGPSGCGKSSLLHLIAGIEQPDRGKITLDHDRITASKVAPKTVILFQHHNLFPWLNLRQNIAFPMKIQGIKKQDYEPMVDEWLERMDLMEFAHYMPEQLSGGMQQRGALARTLIAKPKLVLLDEPFGALDALTRVDMQSLVFNLWHEQHITMLMVTHAIDEALRLGQKIFVLGQHNKGDPSQPTQIIDVIESDFDLACRQDMNKLQDDKKFHDLRRHIATKISQS